MLLVACYSCLSFFLFLSFFFLFFEKRFFNGFGFVGAPSGYCPQLKTRLKRITIVVGSFERHVLRGILGGKPMTAVTHAGKRKHRRTFQFADTSDPKQFEAMGDE